MESAPKLTLKEKLLGKKAEVEAELAPILQAEKEQAEKERIAQEQRAVEERIKQMKDNQQKEDEHTLARVRNFRNEYLHQDIDHEFLVDLFGLLIHLLNHTVDVREFNWADQAYCRMDQLEKESEESKENTKNIENKEQK